MEKTVFVTGGTGFLGSWIMRLFLEDGWQVTALTRKENHFGLFKNEAEKVKWVVGALDALDETIENAMKSCSVVVHSAALVSFAPQDRNEMIDVNVKGTRNLLNTALHLGLKRFIYIGSVSALSRPVHQHDLSESTIWEKSPFNSFYGYTKFQAETEVWRAQAEGLETAVLLPSIILGPLNNWHQGSGELCKTIHKGLKYYPMGSTGFVDVRDVAKVTLDLANTTDLPQQRFLISAENIPYQTILTDLAKAMNKPEPYKPATPFLRAIYWRIEAFMAFIQNRRPLVTKETLTTSSQTYTYSNQRIKETLPDFNFRPMGDTLKDTATSFLETYKEV